MPGQTVHTVCNSLCIFWTHYSMVEPHSSNFRVITTNFLGVRIFRKYTVDLQLCQLTKDSCCMIQVSLFAGVLQKHGVRKGDRVLIYMPMIPEAVVAMLASARLGAVHSLVFGGFASRELSTRIEHAKVCC